jgi:predicted transcriptional regulator
MEQLNVQRKDESEEDPETLAAIEEGLRDAKEGRVVPAEQVRRLVNEWISGFSARKNRKRKT